MKQRDRCRQQVPNNFALTHSVEIFLNFSAKYLGVFFFVCAATNHISAMNYISICFFSQVKLLVYCLRMTATDMSTLKGIFS